MKTTAKLTMVLGITLAIIICAIPAQAGKHEGELKGKYPEFLLYTYQDFSKEDHAAIVVDIKWEAYTLYGEPVFFTKVKWDLQHIYYVKGEKTYSGYVYLKKYDVTLQFHSIPHEILQKIRVTSMIPEFQIGHYSFRTRDSTFVYIHRDVGVLATPGGKWSFNAPGSPKWRECFYYYRGAGYHNFDDREYFKPAESKQIFNLNKMSNDRFDYTLSGFIDIRFDLNAVEKWYEGKLKAEEREKEIQRQAKSGADFFDEDESSVVKKSGDDFFNDESDLETKDEHDKIVQAETKQKEHVAKIQKIHRAFEIEKEKYKGLNFRVEVSWNGKTWVCPSNDFYLTGKIDKRNLNKIRGLTINGQKVDVDGDGVFGFDVKLDEGNNTFKFHNGNSLVLMSTLKYRKATVSTHLEEIDHNCKGSCIVICSYFVYCDFCGAGARCRHSGLAHKPTCPSRCRFE